MIKTQVVDNKALLKKFIDSPYELYKNVPNYVPELRIMQKEVLDRRKNKFFRHAEAEYFVATDENGKTTGRIAAIINRNYQKHWNENYGFFGFFECIDNEDVAGALFDAATGWLKEKGMDGVYGPENPSTNDTCGTLIDGFDTPPYIMMVHNMPYYDKLISGYGFEKKMDLYSYQLNINEFSTKFLRLSEKIEQRLENRGIIIRNVNFKNIKEETAKLRSIYNRAWSKNWGFIPMDEDEFSDLVKELKMVTLPELVFIAEDKGKAVAFIALLPDLNERLIQIRNGRLLPFNFLKLLNFKKKVKRVRVLTLGIIDGYRNSGIDAVMYSKCYEVTKSIGYKEAEASWILENNDMMNRILINTNAKVYKKYRIYGMSFGK